MHQSKAPYHNPIKHQAPAGLPKAGDGSGLSGLPKAGDARGLVGHAVEDSVGDNCVYTGGEVILSRIHLDLHSTV